MYKLIQYPDCVLKYDYYVNEDGLIWSGFSNKEMGYMLDKDGYLRVRLTIENGKRRNFPVHRLVLGMFNPVDDMMNLQVNHKDGNKHNNKLDNLEWCTPQENITHAVVTGLRFDKGENNNSHKLSTDDVYKIKDLYNSGDYTERKIASIYGVHEDTIGKIIQGRTWTHLLSV